MKPTPTAPAAPELDSLDRELIRLSQAGLPISETPFAELAERAGISEELALQRIRQMLLTGAIRRIAAVPNHYRIGFVANGMSVWDVEDERVDELGRELGRLEFVSHCYRRPRIPGEWPYNLFAMLHGRTREEVAGKAERIRGLLGNGCRAHELLFSTRILKKTGFRSGG